MNVELDMVKFSMFVANISRKMDWALTHREVEEIAADIKAMVILPNTKEKS